MTRQPDDMAAQAVLSRLGRGADGARSIGAIQEELGWTRRQVEQAVQQLRLDGHPIASGAPGVWLGDIADMEATFRYLDGRIRSQVITKWAVRATLRRMRPAPVQQETLWPAA